MGDQFWKYGFTAAHVRLGKICAAVKLHLRAKFACNPHHDTTVKLKKILVQVMCAKIRYLQQEMGAAAGARPHCQARSAVT